MRARIAMALAFVAAAPAAAAPPTQINVEIDYMTASDHTHLPDQADIDAVVQMFACRGITLNVLISDAIPEISILRCSNLADDFFDCGGASSFRTLKAQYQSQTGSGWHYAVFGHRYNTGNGTGSSGIAEISGDDLLVTMGSFTDEIGTPFDRAATFAHELGHNLGLRHYGQNSAGDSLGNFQPNYASIMSYQYQLTGVRAMMTCLGLIDDTALYKNLDYSDGRLVPVNEAALSELVGAGVQSTDWDCDGTLDTGTISADLDNARPFCGSTGTVNTLRDYADWLVIEDQTLNPNFDRHARREVATCISREERDAFARWMDPNLCPDVELALVQEPCPSGEMVFVDLNWGGFHDGSGNTPYQTVQSALDNATTGSAIYIQPGTYDNGGAPLVISERVTLSGPGTAIIDP